jgi:hypothetical protein
VGNGDPIRFLHRPNQQAVTVNGAHLLMEDSPNEVGDAIARFVQNVLAGQTRRAEPKREKLGEPLSVGQPRRQ